jgi:hypothetical protein
MPTITDDLAAFGIRHERDEHTTNDYRHSVWQGERFIGRLDAHEAVKLLHDLRYGADEPVTEPTEQGNQFVIPGCERDKSRGPKQMDLF